MIYLLAISVLIMGFFLIKFVRENFQLKIKNTELTTRLKLISEQILADKDAQKNMQEAARFEFEGLAKKIVETESQGILQLIDPLKNQIKDFEKKVQDAYFQEGKERLLLKSEIERLLTLNQKITEETHQLTNALKGDQKFQGDWGEAVLERLLENAGLREGFEYSTQTTFINDENKSMRPDVVIRLPDGKNIIIDSKVSLKAYELYTRENENSEIFIQQHVESIKNHIQELSAKNYPKLKDIHAPDFVFLFMPIEPAYILALKHAPDLASEAWQKGVALVTTSTLMVALKTVASLWRLEQQNKNSQEIASEAAKLYDKFVGFYEDFEKVGKTFEIGLNVFDEAKRKLKDGTGNIYRRIEKLRELGANPTKKLKIETSDQQQLEN